MRISEVLERAVPFVPVITLAARKYDVPVSLMLGIAAAESLFDPNAHRNEPRANSESFGLFQILERTARGLGFTGERALLFNPAMSAQLGAKLMRANIDQAAGGPGLISRRELEDRALSAYNAGWSRARPYDANRTTAGTFVNQEYVDRVRRWQSRLGQLTAGAVTIAGVAIAFLLFRAIAQAAEKFTAVVLSFLALPREKGNAASPPMGSAALVSGSAASFGGL